MAIKKSFPSLNEDQTEITDRLTPYLIEYVPKPSLDMKERRVSLIQIEAIPKELKKDITESSDFYIGENNVALPIEGITPQIERFLDFAFAKLSEIYKYDPKEMHLRHQGELLLTVTAKEYLRATKMRPTSMASAVKTLRKICNDITNLKQTVFINTKTEKGFVKMQIVNTVAWSEDRREARFFFNTRYFEFDTYKRIYPDHILSINPERYPNASKIIKKCYDLHAQNSGKANEGRVSLETLLKCTDLPRDEQTHRKKQDIIDPFFAAVEKAGEAMSLHAIEDSRLVRANKMRKEGEPPIDPIVASSAALNYQEQIETLQKGIKLADFKHYIFIYYPKPDYPGATGTKAAKKRAEKTLRSEIRNAARSEARKAVNQQKKRADKASEDKTPSKASTTKPRF
jgi:hypothetical protein